MPAAALRFASARRRKRAFCEMTNETRWQLLQLRVYEKRIVEAVVFFRRHGIEPILIKGWAAAQAYPKPEQRRFTDIDFLVSASEYEPARRLLKKNAVGIEIDLHREARRLDTVAYEDLFLNSVLKPCGDMEVRVLRPEDHLRVLCVHWLRDCGQYRHRLWDIRYAIENRPPNFDWKRFLDTISRTRRRWIVCTIGLTHKYLGLNLEGTPFEEEDLKKLPRWLTETVEREWKEQIFLAPLGESRRDRKKLLEQLKKRFPPNAIRATIDLEGEFDDKPRIFYQILDIFYRFAVSLRRAFDKP